MQASDSSRKTLTGLPQVYANILLAISFYASHLTLPRAVSRQLETARPTPDAQMEGGRTL